MRVMMVGCDVCDVGERSEWVWMSMDEVMGG